MKVATSASSTGQLSKGEQEFSHYPLSLWALANLVSLAHGSSAKRIDADGHFVKGLVLEEYVLALCCLLNDLTPWVESKQQECLKSRYSNEDTDEIEALRLGFRGKNSPHRSDGDQSFGTSSVLPLLCKTLKPLYQTWHLALLLGACDEKRCGTETTGVDESPRRSLQLPEVANLYSSSLVAFSIFKQNGGQLPILNLLAFSQTLLPRLWVWLQLSLNLQLPSSKGINGSHAKSSSQLSKSLAIPKEGNSGKQPAAGKWAAALGLKMRIRNTGAEGSSSSDKPQIATREGDSDESSPQLWDLQSMRSGPGGVPLDAVPVLSLFCAAYAHRLMVVDDEEFYERQVWHFMARKSLLVCILNSKRLISIFKVLEFEILFVVFYFFAFFKWEVWSKFANIQISSISEILTR